MADHIEEAARLMRVIDAIMKELARQGVAKATIELGFDPSQLAKVAIMAADGSIIKFPPPLAP